MKLPKKIYVASAALLFAAGTVAAFALRPDTKPISVAKTGTLVRSIEQKPQSEPSTTTQSLTQTVQPTVQTSEEEPNGTVLNPYLEGSSLWFVWGKRTEIGRPIPANWGNGGSWPSMAAAAGYTLDNTAEVGAIVCGSRNEVSVVDIINEDGSVVLRSGVSTATTITAAKATTTVYIH